jgi:hypothetical protein
MFPYHKLPPGFDWLAAWKTISDMVILSAPPNIMPDEE